MNSGSSIVECLVALLLTATIACVAISSLRAGSVITRDLKSHHHLTEITDAIDGFQSLDPTRSRELLADAVVDCASRIDNRALRCSLEVGQAVVRCADHERARIVPLVALPGNEER